MTYGQNRFFLYFFFVNLTWYYRWYTSALQVCLHCEFYSSIVLKSNELHHLLNLQKTNISTRHTNKHIHTIRHVWTHSHIIRHVWSRGWEIYSENLQNCFISTLTAIDGNIIICLVLFHTIAIFFPPEVVIRSIFCVYFRRAAVYFFWKGHHGS